MSGPHGVPPTGDDRMTGRGSLVNNDGTRGWQGDGTFNAWSHADLPGGSVLQALGFFEVT